MGGFALAASLWLDVGGSQPPPTGLLASKTGSEFQFLIRLFVPPFHFFDIPELSSAIARSPSAAM